MAEDQSKTQPQVAMGLMEWGLLISLSILWGGSFFFVGVAVKELPPLTIVFARVGIAALALWSALILLDIRMPQIKGLWFAFLGMGLLNNAIPFTFFVWGQQYIASGLAAILNATTPIFTLLVAHFLTRDERLNLQKICGVCIGFLGVLLMLGTDILSGLGNSVGAQLACLAAALSYAFAGVFGRRFKRLGVPPLVTATGQVTASTALLFPLVLFFDEPWSLALPGATTWAALLGIGVISTAFAYILYFRILATAGATNLLLVTLLIPVSAILLGTLLLNEILETKHFVGITIIVIGLLFLDGRAMSNLTKRSSR